MLIPFLVKYPKELKTETQQIFCTSMFTAAFVHNTQKVEAT